MKIVRIIDCGDHAQGGRHFRVVTQDGITLSVTRPGTPPDPANRRGANIRHLIPLGGDYRSPAWKGTEEELRLLYAPDCTVWCEAECLNPYPYPSEYGVAPSH